jgi:hypothetical protein
MHGTSRQEIQVEMEQQRAAGPAAGRSALKQQQQLNQQQAGLYQQSCFIQKTAASDCTGLGSSNNSEGKDIMPKVFALNRVGS